MKYYFNDVWVFESGVNQWVERSTTGEQPQPRRGHKIVARRHRSNDTQLILFAGHNQDTPFNDMWVLNLMREDPEDRVWTRIDHFFIGNKPPPLTHGSVLYLEDLRQIVVIGGLTWNPTDLAAADHRNNVDRRCLKEAQGLPEMYQGMQEATFLSKMRKLCLDKNVVFCCAISQFAKEGEDYFPPEDYIDAFLVRTDKGYLNLTALSILCRQDCENNLFITEFKPNAVEGVYTFSVEACENNCSSHGTCDLSQCVCEPDWYGVDCSLPRCPGSVCYTHPRTKEQFCIDCSQHGRCIDGTCDCFTGWGRLDCSAPMCEANCSSTPDITRGVCVEDYPVSQCSCVGRWSGYNCSDLLCLNGCGGRGRCLNGQCACDRPYFGDDCSLFIFEPKD